MNVEGACAGSASRRARSGADITETSKNRPPIHRARSLRGRAPIDPAANHVDPFNELGQG